MATVEIMRQGTGRISWKVSSDNVEDLVKLDRRMQIHYSKEQQEVLDNELAHKKTKKSTS